MKVTKITIEVPAASGFMKEITIGVTGLQHLRESLERNVFEKVATIKAVRAKYELGLYEAKTLVDQWIAMVGPTTPCPTVSAEILIEDYTWNE